MNEIDRVTEMAWRHPKRGKAHRLNAHGRTACSNLTIRDYEPEPLEQVPPAWRCRSCFRSPVSDADRKDQP